MNADDQDGPADERCPECAALDPSRCLCPPAEVKDDLVEALKEFARADADLGWRGSSDVLVLAEELAEWLRDRGLINEPPVVKVARGHARTKHTYDETARRWVCVYPACPQKETDE